MGFVRNLNIGIALFLLFNNVVSVFVYKTGTDFYINVIISVIIIILNIPKSNKYISISYIIIGLVVIVFGTRDNFSGIISIVMGCYLFKNKYLYVVCSILVIVSMILKYSFMDFPISSLANHLMIYLYVSYLFYRIFWNVSQVNEEYSKSNGLTPEQIDTIKMLKQGYRHQKAAQLLNIERKTFSARVSSLRKRFKVDTDFQLAIVLIENDIISLNELAKSKSE